MDERSGILFSFFLMHVLRNMISEKGWTSISG
jgi:hypothetical protein